MSHRGLIGITDPTGQAGILTTVQLRELSLRQKQCVEWVQAYQKVRKPGDPYPAIAMPTGFGKGRVVHRLIEKAKRRRVLLIAGTKHLLRKQSVSVLEQLSRMELEQIVTEDTEGRSFSIFPDCSGDVVVTIWQTLDAYAKRYEELPEKFGTIVIDEFHNTGTKRRIDLLKRLDVEQVIGLTATPYRSTGEYKDPEQYGFKVVDSATLPGCIRKGWLAPLLGLSIDTGVVLPRDARENGRLRSRRLYRELRKYPELFRNIAREIVPFIQDGKKTIVAVNRIREEACVIADELKSQGITVGLAVNDQAAKALAGQYITLDAIERYGLPASDPRAIQVLISPQVIGEGFDHPSTECVVWAAPTMSGLRYTQVMGRGARRCQGKRYCLVLDFVYLIEGYGYSLNFAQFFRKEELQQLGDYAYLGPAEAEMHKLLLPQHHLDQGKIVPILKLQYTVPDQGDWLSFSDLVRELGMSESWVRNRLVHPGMPAGEERRITTGQAHTCYPPETLAQLRAILEAIPDAGNWVTVYTIQQAIGKSDEWVVRRLEEPGMPTGEERRIPDGHFTTCYPPEVIEILRQRAQWLTSGAIARELGQTTYWVQQQLAKPGMPTGERRGSRGDSFYPPETVELLRPLLP